MSSLSPRYATGAADAVRWYKQGGDILIFIAISLVLAIFIGQDEIVSKRDIQYWLLILPALVFPVLRLRQTLGSLIGGLARPVALFCALSGAWFVARGDYSVVPPLVLFGWVTAWVLRSEVRINLNALLVLLLAFYAMGTVRYYTQPSTKDIAWMNAGFTGEPDEFLASTNIPAESITVILGRDFIPAPDYYVSGNSFEEGSGDTIAGRDFVGGPDDLIQLRRYARPVEPNQRREGLNLNGWGVLPQQTVPTFGPWRISVTPNIATSGTVAFFTLILALSPFAARLPRLVAVVSSGYFMFFSFVRSALIAFLLFVATQLGVRLFKRQPRLKMAMAILLVTSSVLVTAIAPYFMYVLQNLEIVSRLLLRGQTELSLGDIYRQMYRPWLWGEHFKLFLSSEFWMGQGGELAKSAQQTGINAGHARSDSVSLLTRFLATYGLPTLFLFWFFVHRIYHHIRNDDIWGVAAASAIIWLMMTWGSVFHPTNALFVLAILVLGRGSEVFVPPHKEKN